MKLVIILFSILIILVLVILYLHWNNFITIPRRTKLRTLIGGCKGTHYGCCSDGKTSRNKHGTNC